MPKHPVNHHEFWGISKFYSLQRFAQYLSMQQDSREPKCFDSDEVKEYLQPYCGEDLNSVHSDLLKSKISAVTDLTLSAKIHTLFDLSPFSSLQELWLNTNLIATIEQLPRMNIPKMRKLSFSENHIVSIAPFRRLNLPLLEQVQLNNNKIIEPHRYWELFLSKRPVNMWIYYGAKEKTLQAKNINTVINAKFGDQKLKMRD